MAKTSKWSEKEVGIHSARFTVGSLPSTLSSIPSCIGVVNSDKRIKPNSCNNGANKLELPWNHWSIMKLPNTTVRWQTESECNTSIRSAINVPIVPGGRYIKTTNICVSPALNKTVISMCDLIGNSFTEKILEVW